MPDQIGEILTEIAQSPATTAETTETVQETVATESQPVDSQNEPVLTEIAQEATPSAAETTTVTPSFDELFAQKTGGKSYDEFMKEVDDLRSKDFTYKTDFGKVFDELLASNVAPETIVKFGKLDINSMDNMSAVKLLKEVKSSYLSKDEIEALVDTEYGVEEDADDRQKLIANAKLKEAGEQAKKELAEMQGKVLNVTKTDPVAEREQALKVKEAERLQSWESKAKDVVAKVNKLTFPLSIQVHGEKGVEKKSYSFDYPVPKEHQAQIQELTNQIVSNFAVAPDENGINQVYQTVLDSYFLKNKDAIISSAISTALSQQDKANALKYNNATTAQRTPEMIGKTTDASVARLEATIANL